MSRAVSLLRGWPPNRGGDGGIRPAVLDGRGVPSSSPPLENRDATVGQPFLVSSADAHKETSQLSVPTTSGDRMLHKRRKSPDAIGGHVGGHLLQEARDVPGSGQFRSVWTQQEDAQRAHGLRKRRGVIAKR